MTYVFDELTQKIGYGSHTTIVGKRILGKDGVEIFSFDPSVAPTIGAEGKPPDPFEATWRCALDSAQRAGRVTQELLDGYEQELLWPGHA